MNIKAEIEKLLLEYLPPVMYLKVPGKYGSGSYDNNKEKRDKILALFSQEQNRIREELEKLKIDNNGASPNKKSFGEGEYTDEQELFCRIGYLNALDDALRIAQGETGEE